MKLMRSVLLFVTLAFAPNASAQNADINFLRDIHTPIPHNADVPMRIVSGSVLPMMIAIPIGLGTYQFCKHKTLIIPHDPSHFVVAGAVVSASAIALGLKYAVNRPRPFVTYPDITKKDEHAGPYSFPSGHTANAFALATSLSICYPKWYVIVPSFAWACTVGYSRMWLGVHYPSDLLTGALIGAGSAVLSYYFTRWVMKTYYGNEANPGMDDLSPQR